MKKNKYFVFFHNFLKYQNIDYNNVSILVQNFEMQTGWYCMYLYIDGAEKGNKLSYEF